MIKVGVFGSAGRMGSQVVQAVTDALEVGYRHIDTAAAYGNEREVGEAIRRFGLARDEVFVETKIWISDYGYDETLHSFDKSAGKLGVEQIDLLVLHQALPGEFDTTIGAYRALERLLAEPDLVAQTRVNTKKQFMESQDFQAAVTEAVVENQDAHNTMADYFFSDGPGVSGVVVALADAFYETACEDSVDA